MKLFLSVLLCYACMCNAFAQNKAGLTGVSDTSYSLYSAYINTIKSNPGIKIVNEILSDSIKENRNVVYCKTGKRNLKVDIFSPLKKSKEKHTAIIIIHGGGWRSGNKSLHHPMAQILAQMGYVCFTPEYRLSTEALYPAAVYDIKSVIRWVRKNAKRYHIDLNKIVVGGHSAGGELAAMMGATNNITSFEGKGCLLNYSSKANAVIDIDGLLAFIHPESGEGDDSKRISAATNWFGYTKTENPELWKQGSPLTHAGQHTPPFLFINSNVARMHAGREDFIKILNDHNIYSEIKSIDAPHSFIFFEPWFKPAIKYMDDFIKKVLPK